MLFIGRITPSSQNNCLSLRTRFIMQIFRNRLCVLTLLSFFIFGCEGAYRPAHIPRADVENTETFVLLTKNLKNQVTVEGQRAKWTDKNLLEVQARIRNRMEEPLQVEVQTVFKDKEKMLSVYPNPFAKDIQGHVRFVYSNPYGHPGKINIFDFSMDQVIHLNNNNPFALENDQNEVVWNGRNEYRDKVANGVYFCRLSLNGQTYWTKLAVIN